MQDVDLARVADELYALSPGDFREARDRRAAEIRVSGDRDLARAVGALRRPVVSAWLVNLLVREAGGQMDDLLALGESLREAQRDLAGDRLRELSAQRRQVVAALLGEAKRIAARDGRPAGLQVEREVEATLQAALADADAAAAVSSGCLTGPLSYAGLGMGEAASVVAVPAARRRAREATATAPDRPAPDGAAPEGAAKARREGAGKRRPRETPEEREARLAAAAAEREARQAAAAAERRAAQIEAAERDVQQATDTAAEARTALGEAERQAAAARAAQEAIRQRVERLDRELSEAIAEESRANRAVRDAQRAKDVAARAVTTADQRLARAQAAARKLA